jgi:hypothetical protein
MTKKIVLTGLFCLLVGLASGHLVAYYAYQDLSQEKEISQAVKYNCEFSGGSFVDGSCACPTEIGQDSAEMYDERTGYCQTTHGGPGGNAFEASIGLPYGDFAFWAEIVQESCEASGGEFLNARCTCPEGVELNSANGACEHEGVSVGDDWMVYTDTEGRFMFRHPDYVRVSASEDGNHLTVLNADIVDPVPDMTIRISDTGAAFAAWENFDIEYLKALVSSFRYLK